MKLSINYNKLDNKYTIFDWNTRNKFKFDTLEDLSIFLQDFYGRSTD